MERFTGDTVEMTKKLTILSLGAGVQSTCLALMAAKGEVTPMPDYAIFADTGAEPRHVYDHLEWLEEQLPFPVLTVQHGNLWKDTIKSAKEGTRVANAPFYTKAKDGSRGILKRTCTLEYKITPIQRKIRQLLGFKKGQRVKDAHVEQWIGISYDEMTRMKESPDKWVTHRWPLVEKEMRRGQCLEWLKTNGYPEAPRSACTFCPYHKNDYWRYLKNEWPDDFEEACEFDEKIRGGINKASAKDFQAEELYLHSDLIPLRKVDVRNDIDKGQLTFLDECDGVCML